MLNLIVVENYIGPAIETNKNTLVSKILGFYFVGINFKI